MGYSKALLVAFFLHAFVLFSISVTFGASQGVFSRGEFFFWGSIVRKEELLPGQPGGVLFLNRTLVNLPVRSRMSSRLWSKSVAVDKAEMISSAHGPLPDPQKFLGPRVRLERENNEDNTMKSLEMPAPVKVQLRYPKQ